MASVFTNPLRQTYRYFQRHAHENTVIFYSVVLGTIGPVMVVAVPPIRESFGYRPAEPVPTSYPVPNRARRPIQGYEDQ